MPFTFAHPVLVLPFIKLPNRYFSLIALVIGSIAPDAEYFIRFRVLSIYSHTLSGLLYFDVPVGIALYGLYTYFIRNMLVQHLPSALKSRFVGFSGTKRIAYRKGDFLMIIFSLLLGAVSHVMWDSFTHEQGYFVRQIDELKMPLVVIGIKMPLYKWLQHTSTVVGLVGIALVIYALPKGTVSVAKSRSYWLIVAAVSGILFVGRFLIFDSFTIGNAVVTAIPAIFLGLLSASIYKLYFVGTDIQSTSKST